MGNDDRIDVEYDTRGINLPEGNFVGYENNLSEYLYPKLQNVDNKDETGSVEFTNNEINEYSLDVKNGKINISTTKKLIKYLKAFARKKINNVHTAITEELTNKFNQLNNNITSAKNEVISYVNNEIDELDDEISDELENKANLIHYHDAQDIGGLADYTDLFNNRISQMSQDMDFYNGKLSTLQGQLDTLTKQYYKNNLVVKIGRWRDNEGEDGSRIQVPYSPDYPDGIYAKLYSDDPNFHYEGRLVVFYVATNPTVNYFNRYERKTDANGKTGKLDIRLNPGFYMMYVIVNGVPEENSYGLEPNNPIYTEKLVEVVL